MVVEQKHNSLEGRIADKISKLWKDTANVIIKIALESNENNIRKIVRNYPVKHSAFWSEDANYLGQNNHFFFTTCHHLYVFRNSVSFGSRGASLIFAGDQERC